MVENKENIMTAKDIADDVQQTFENVSNEYRKILEDRIIKFAYEINESQKALVGLGALAIEKIFNSNKKYTNKIIPEKGKTYRIIVETKKELEIVEDIGIYSFSGWLQAETKQSIYKVLAWKEI